MKTHFQCIVVGGGIAGSAAAIRLAQNGVDVLLVERADEGGAKNLSGGILWGDDLAQILPDWKAEAPVDRPVTQKRVGFLGDDSSFVMDFQDESLKTDTIGYAVLRAKLDKWLLEQAEAAGAIVVTGVNVEGLYREAGVVKGVHQGGEVTTADCVIIADGANSRITLQGDLRHGQKKLDAAHYALGVKEILKLPKETLQERFQVDEDGGMAGEFVLGRDDGIMAGGFVYTNNDTLSLGVVVNLETMKDQGDTATHDVMEDFRTHPYIQRLTEGAELVEYGAHLVPEGGHHALAELYTDGALVVGDAAGFCFSNGIVIQGMNYAVRSGIMAADTVILAAERGDFSQVTLKHYEHLLEKDGVLGDFAKFKDMHQILWNPRLFKDYPKFLRVMWRSILGAEGKKMTMKQHLFHAVSETGLNKRKALQDVVKMGVKM